MGKGKKFENVHYMAAWQPTIRLQVTMVNGSQPAYIIANLLLVGALGGQ